MINLHETNFYIFTYRKRLLICVCFFMPVFRCYAVYSHEKNMRLLASVYGIIIDFDFLIKYFKIILKKYFNYQDKWAEIKYPSDEFCK